MIKAEKAYQRKKKIAKIKERIGYIFVLAVVAGCHYVAIVVAANSDMETTQKWTKNFLLSLAQDMGTTQMFKVMMTVIVMKIISRGASKRKIKILRRFLDPLTARALVMKSIL